MLIVKWLHKIQISILYINRFRRVDKENILFLWFFIKPTQERLKIPVTWIIVFFLGFRSKKSLQNFIKN